MGGAKNQSNQLQVSTGEGNYEFMETSWFEQNAKQETVKAQFFDSDNDGDLDLWVGNGGSAFSRFSRDLDDHFYENVQGRLEYRPKAISLTRPISTGAVTVADFDNDGNTDVFIGEYLKGLNYGIPGDGLLFRGNGNNAFKPIDVAAFKNLGMITGAQFSDLNNDGWIDLVIVGDWMPITVFINEKGTFKKTAIPGLEKTRGNWSSLRIADINQDGTPDIVAGNMGENNFFEEQMRMYVADFDQNGRLDHILAFKRADQYYPIVDKDELIAQMPSLKKKVLYYKDYAQMSITDLFNQDILEKAIKYEIDTRKSAVFLNRNGIFESLDLPQEVQYSSIYAWQEMDVNDDGIMDLIFGGNQFHIKPQFGRQDASKGGILFGEMTDGQYKLTAFEHLGIEGQIRVIVPWTRKENKGILVARNNQTVVHYEKK